RKFIPAWIECWPCVHVRLSTICGAVIPRCVCGETQYGIVMPFVAGVMMLVVSNEPYIHSSAHGGTLLGSPKLGFDSPKVKLNLKRLNPAVSSFTNVGEKVWR